MINFAEKLSGLPDDELADYFTCKLPSSENPSDIIKLPARTVPLWALKELFGEARAIKLSNIILNNHRVY